MDKVIIFSTECILQFAFYGNNTIAIDAIRAKDGEPCWRFTVNWEKNYQGTDYKDRFKFPIVVIKNYSENKGVYAELIHAKVITPGFNLPGSSGNVQSATLTEKWQEVAKMQLGEI